MPISCINVGRRFYKGITQRVSLGLIMLVFAIFIVMGSLSIEIYKKQAESRITLCKKFVTNKEVSGTDYGVAKAISLTCSIVFSLFFVMSSYNVMTTSYDKLRDSVIPIILFIIAGVCISLSIYFDSEYDSNEDIQQTTVKDVDIEVIKWCDENRDLLKNLYRAVAVFLGLGVVGFVYYITNLLSVGCVVY
jgi:hypothetical protein